MKRLALLTFLAACGGGDDAGVAPDADPGAPDATIDDGRLTLANCETSIDDDVPAFYKKYFQCSTITVSGNGTVTLTSNGLPPHQSYYYGAGNPNFVAWDDRGGDYHANPNTLTEKAFAVAVPPDPTPKGVTIDEALVDGIAGTAPPYELVGGPIGMTLDGVAEFSGLAAPGDDIATEKFTFDPYNAHPAPNQQYHYHTMMPGPLEVLAAKGLDGVEVYGIQCDGTVLLGCTELDGSAPTGALDAQGGHVGDLVDEEGTTHFTGRYHVHVCEGIHEFTPEIQYYTTCSRPNV